MAFRSEDRVCYEFDEFFVDPVRRVLLRGDVALQVSPKALSILVALLAQPGEVVEKQDLIETVWAGANVSEANLTQNVFALRKILGEKANDSRYIVTVPGRGYSFAGEVRRIERAATGVFPVVALPPNPPSPPPAEPEKAMPAASATPAIPPAPASTPVTSTTTSATTTGTLPVTDSSGPIPAGAPRRSHAGRWTALLVLGLLGGILLGVLHFRGGAIPAAAVKARRPSIVVLDFRGLAPKKETDWLPAALPSMLASDLAAGGKLRVLRGENVAQTLRSLSYQKNGILSRDDLERLHAQLGADLVVLGTYLPLGDELRLDLRVVRAPQADTAASLAEVGSGKEIFDLVARTGVQLREALGVAALSPEQARQTQALRPSSPESLRLYHEGLIKLRAFDPPGARDLLQQAVEADPGSAIFHSALSEAWSSLGYDGRAEAEARRAADLAGSLGQEERLAINGRLHQVGQKWDLAAETYRSLWTFFPDEIEYGLQLADSQIAAGHGVDAAVTIAALRRLPPPVGQDPRIDLAETRNARRLSDLATQLRSAETAAAKGRLTGQIVLVSRALIFQGDALVKMGRARQALGLFNEALALAQRSGHQWQVGMALANRGLALKSLGDLDGSESANKEALGIAQRAGSGVGIAAELLSLAEIHWERGELGEARVQLEQARSWYVEIGDRVSQSQVQNRLGEVMSEQGDLAGAREQFEKALRLGQSMGHPAVQAQCLDHLGNILALQGDLAGARDHHEQALGLFHPPGDPRLSAAALVVLAELSARQGDVRGAWQRSNQALAAKREAGDKLGMARLLDLQARLAYDRGDLTASRSLATDQLRLARELGARSLAAAALRNLGRAALAAGDPEGARKSFQEALDISSALGGNLQATEIRLDQARLALAEGQFPKASKMARELASWYQERRMDGGESLALTLLAEALLAQGSRAEASRAAGEARSRLGASEDLKLRVEMAAPLAHIAIAAGQGAGALRDLRQAIVDAERTGLVASGLEARLTLAQIQRELKDPAGEILLAAVRRDAETRGFHRLAVLATPQAPRPAPLG